MITSKRRIAKILVMITYMNAAIAVSLYFLLGSANISIILICISNVIGIIILQLKCDSCGMSMVRRTGYGMFLFDIHPALKIPEYCRRCGKKLD